jgi:peptide/nickel transport system substrate-binding protein
MERMTKMKKTRKLLALSLAIIMCLALLAACGGNNTGQSPSQQQPSQQQPSQPGGPQQPIVAPTEAPPDDAVFAEEITVIISNNRIAVLDVASPASSADTIGWSLNAFLSTLYDFDTVNPGKYLPSLAKSYETNDMQTITFNLRDDVYFHTGEKLTADDVAFTIDRAKENPGTNAFDRFNKIQSYEVIGDYTIKLDYGQVNVDFIAELSWSHTGILSRKALQDDPTDGYLIGTGPWIVDEFVPNDFVRFVRNENYWGPLPETKVLTFKFIAEEATRLTMLENRNVDAAFSINPNDFPYLEGNPDKFNTYSWVVNNVGYVSFNMTDPLMSDINFRKAVASALNRQQMIQAGRNGYAMEPTSGAFWGWATEFKNEDIPIIPHNIEAAKNYLAQSSYKGETVTITAAIVDFIKMAEVLQQQLKAIGVNAEINQTDIAGLSSVATYSNNSTHMLIHTGTWMAEATSSRNFLYPGASNNRASYLNQQVADLLDAAGSETDAVKREAMYKQIQAIVAEDLP